MHNIFSLPDMKFPAGFLWGSATAGHQIEGDNIHSNWWEKEKTWDMAKSGKACNSYILYKEDVALLKSLGHTAYRLSIEWARIEPEQGKFNSEALTHYIEILELLKEAGIATFVTLHHFSHPQWFEVLGAFQKIENLRYFEAFVNYTVPKIASLVDYWIVINEFNLGNSDERITHKLNSLQFHARGYHCIKQYSSAPISSAHAFFHYFPNRRHDAFDNILTSYNDWRDNEFFFHAIRTGEILFPHRNAQYIPEVKGTADYWAVNYYTRQIIDGRMATLFAKPFPHKRIQMIPIDFYLEEFFPEGLVANLERITDKPVHITENGCACNDDRFRIIYLELHLAALKEAIDRGVDIRSYLHWSLLDNYEWGSFEPRFGLVHVDFKTFTRTPKPSAYFFKDIIENNGLTKEIIRKHLKDIPQSS